METPLYEKIYLNLLNQIETGQLKPRDQVPTEKELADQYQVSRITSKKALEKLVQIGAIERIRGKGSFVSNTLPDFGAISPKTNSEQRDHLIQEMNELIGLIIPEFFRDCFGRQILSIIEKRCSELKFNLLVKVTYGSQEEEEDAINTMVQQQVKGIIIFPVHGHHYTTSLLRLVLEGFPLVLIDRYLKGIPACAVYTDNHTAAQSLTEFLFTRGHEHIAFVSPPEEYTSSIEERIQGFKTAYLQKGIAVNPSYILADMFSTLPTFDRSAEFFEDQIKLRNFIQENSHVTAFIACEYEIACVLAQVLKSLGKSIPDDYAIACFDHPGWLYNDMIFTHIKQDEDVIGSKAVELLLKQIQGETVPVQNMVDYKLIEGNTI
ncbi:substrate-binding domain-containing protein [Bacillus sp. ISL-40]|uniref:GntR family transcriptional regulator n=1 Tax=unclassified Bacillus (in: firmicutes) TaxID=185979 RepID=UPI001BE9B612|nr:MULTISPECIES: substrate-binding domain-containing protein [unclassified Bacillus (in: firmicutes)]MBT2698566.1 substrate-binding domain-containing protein [Bacillus sp. ISL-40]MBT2720199.1 substrate-binding domain-containing protein [Bacillus sp. ISL-46]MBT2739208.1 substrate-binding domain-containing protein [Bacillus sp. ISL-77]